MALDTATRERIVADSATIVARYPQPRSALLPMLHLVQSEEGYVSPDGITLCAEILGMSTAEVSAVSTFYTQYKRHPNGEYTVGVCTNTLCAVMGGDAVFSALSEHLGIGHDETTDDGRVTLERVECNAACDYAPVVMVNWEFFDNQTPSSARGIVDALQAGQDVVPTRGASSVCTFKQVSRLLAGFDDGRADEGVGAGPASVVGLKLAKEKGWTAPAADSHGARRKGAAGAEREPARTRTSAHDAPTAKGERAGTVAGKPSGDATQSASDQSSASDAATEKEG